MARFCRTSLLGVVALFAATTAPYLSLAVEDLNPMADNGSVQIPLPEANAPGQMRWLEWSTNMVDWEPVARDYGYSWENQFPHALPVEGPTNSQSLIHPEGEVVRYYRIAEAPVSGKSNFHLVSRFLQQSTFGPTREMITFFPGVDTGAEFNAYPYIYYEQWIDEQIAIPMTSLRAFWRERSNPAYVDNTAKSPFEVAHNPAYGTQLPYWTGGRNPEDKHLVDTARAVAAGRPSNDVTFSLGETKQIVWYQAAVTGEDALRQRAAWSLSQIFVVGEAGSVQTNASERFLKYYDIFIRHAFGNFRDILGEVTFSPIMGDYLTYIDNQKANPILGTFPDENYAREVMQLFTIGLWELNQDGTPVLDENGNGIPTYDNDDIFEFAKIFTGLRRQYDGRGGNGSRDNIETKYGNFIDPLRMQANRHDFSAKTLLDGSILGPYPQTNDGGIDEINAFLDYLFNHPNTAPFISRLLIQRLTVSNPSPTYIHAVAQAFIDGTFMGKGSGQRGDLTAVFKAILLHPEAREPALGLDSSHGKLREPLVRLLHYARSFVITSPQTFGFFPFWQLDEVIAQSPFDYPSVFNFYLPEFQPLGQILDRGLNGPEFEITTDVTSLGLANAIRTLVYEGIADDIGARGYNQGFLDLTHEIILADSTTELIGNIDLILTAGRLTPENRQILFDIIDPMPFATVAQRQERVRLALSLVALFPEFNVIY
jgi:uncharacterized protein (DUF1800 family)